MKRFTVRLSFLLLVAGGCLQLFSCTSPESPDELAREETVVRYGVTVKSGPMDTVLLKDYSPDTSLVVNQTHLSKARFPVVDVHTHVYADTPEEVADWVETMDQVGIDVTVVLTDAVGAEFDRIADLYLKDHADRFQLFCGIDLDNFDDPGYSERVVTELVRCFKRGARGVGEVSDKGWGLGGSTEDHMPQDRRLHPNDSRLDGFWEKCAALKLPVNLHIADHPSCWKPLGPNWERTPDFQGFNLYEKDVPSYEDLLGFRDDLLAKHPDTVFIACHLSNQGNDLTSLAGTLDKYPNLYLDISARDYEIGRQPGTAAAFLERYADRVFFGTDMGRERHMYEAWWRLLESPDEFMPGRLWWRLYGLELKSEVLEKLYARNARQILNWTAVKLN